MNLQRMGGVLLAGMACALQVFAAPRAAGQSVFFASRPIAPIHSAAKSGAAQPARRIPFSYSLRAGIPSPSGAFHPPARRLDFSVDSPQPGFRIQPRLDPARNKECELYFSYPLIEDMESSFKTLDTPFASEVQLSLGTAWRGRIRIGWFANTRAMDTVVLGPPVAGMVSGGRLVGGGLQEFEDDVYGLQMMIRIHRRVVDPEDSNALRGLHRAYRTGRGLFLR